MLNRRHLMAFLGLASTVHGSARGQPRVHRIGLLDRRVANPTVQGGLFRRLEALGYREGGNLVVERRIFQADGPDRRGALAQELANLDLELVVAPGEGAAQAMRAASRNLPIVMPWCPVDPVAAGFAASLARPGGNVTGLTLVASATQWGKSVQLFKEALPALKTLTVLTDADVPGQDRTWAAVEEAARQLQVRLDPIAVRSQQELVAALDGIVARKPQAVWIWAGPTLDVNAGLMAERLRSSRIPAFASFGAYVNAGCLMAYSVNFPDLYVRAAGYVDRILRGAKPGDLPIEHPTAYELVVNQRTAQAIGLTLPQSILLQASRVID